MNDEQESSNNEKSSSFSHSTHKTQQQPSLEEIASNAFTDKQMHITRKKTKHVSSMNTFLKKKKSRENKFENTTLDMDYLHKLVYPEWKEYLSNPNSFIDNPFHNGITCIESIKLNKREINSVSKGVVEITNSNTNNNTNAKCHFCQREETTNETRIIKCAFPNCNEAFCYECYEQTNEINGLSEQFQDSKNNNKWKCFKCRHICKCAKCRYFNRKKRRNSKKKKYQNVSSSFCQLKSTSLSKATNNNNNINDNKLVIQIPYESIDIEENIQPQNVYVNGFNLIELEEEREKTYILSNDLNKMSFNKKELIKLYSVRKRCEEFYLNRHGECVINVKCLKCGQECFFTNELLYFEERKDLINYIKYCFSFLRKIIFINMDIYTDNSYSLQKYDNTYFKNWKFVYGKTMCKMCFMEVVNMRNLFLYLKNIFCDVVPQMYNIDNNNTITNNNNNKTRIGRIKEGFGHKKKKKLRLKEISEQKKYNQFNCNSKDNSNNNKVIFDNVNNTIIIFKKELIDYNGINSSSNNNNSNSNSSIININKPQEHLDMIDKDSNKKQKTTYLRIKTSNKKKPKSNVHNDNKAYTTNINEPIHQQETQPINDINNKDSMNLDLIEKEDSKLNVILNINSNNTNNNNTSIINKLDGQLSQISEIKNFQYQINESIDSYEQSEIESEQEFQNTVFITNKHLMCLICKSNNLLNVAKKLLMLATVQNSPEKIQQMQTLNHQMCTEFKNYIDAFEKMYFINIHRLYSYWRFQNINTTSNEIYKLCLQLQRIFEIGKYICMNAYSHYCLFYSVADSMNRQQIPK